MTMNEVDRIKGTLARWQLVALIAAIAGGIVCALAAMTDVQQFLRSYLIGFLFWWTVTVGCLGLLMLYFMVGGGWGATLRPLLESGGLMAPLTAVLFIPVGLGIEYIYPWAQTGVAVPSPDYRAEADLEETTEPTEAAAAGATAADSSEASEEAHTPGTHPPQGLTPEKAAYLDPPFFFGRAIAYFVIWSLLAILLRDRQREVPRPRWQRLLSAGGLVLLFLTVTFAAIDWAMSLDPAWYSSIYGASVAIGSALTGMTLVTAAVATLKWRHRLSPQVIATDRLADCGTLTLAFLMLWAYFAFSQLLIIWSANLPEENIWYINRLNGGWQWLIVSIVLLQFVVPFFLLLSRDAKRSPGTLAGITTLIFVMQFLYVLWTLSPSFHPQDLAIHWADAAAPVAIGGLWLALFLGLARQRVARIAVLEQV